MWNSLLKLVFVNRRVFTTVFLLTTSYLFYHQSIGKKSQLLHGLESQQNALIQEKVVLIERQKDLMLELASASDPAWVELSLMRRLGVVPEGQVKVHFSSSP